MIRYFQIKWEPRLLAVIVFTDALTIQDQRRTQIRALNAVAQFRAAEFDAAIDTFIELDFNPAKVVALYPESVAGRLSVPQEGWISLYGGPSEEDHGLRGKHGMFSHLPPYEIKPGLNYVRRPPQIGRNPGEVSRRSST